MSTAAAVATPAIGDYVVEEEAQAPTDAVSQRQITLALIEVGRCASWQIARQTTYNVP